MAMQLNSLGYRTDLIFAKYDGEVTDRGAYLVIRTPSNPTYWWGNFLLFAGAPEEGDDERWLALFRKEIGEPPAVRHIAIGWDTVDGETGVVAPFLARGLELETSVVLSAKTVLPPPKRNEEADIRPLKEDREWDEAVELQVLCRDDGFEEPPYRTFRRRKMASYRAMAEDGLGNWFGAFLGGKLVADLGVFKDGPLGRFQSVETHPDYRRRGLCGTLVHAAAEHAYKDLGVETLVMVADPEYHAARIYESVGFEVSEYQVGLTRRAEN